MNQSNMEKRRLFVDMDGTLAVFRVVDSLETLYEPGYFLNLQPQENVVQAVKLVAKYCPDIEVCILSSVLSDSPYALSEKNAWLDKYLPEIDREHRFFPTCGVDKKYYVSGVVGKNDYLLDDYTHNLTLWEPPGRGIKLLNDINHTKGTWRGSLISKDNSPVDLARKLEAVMYYEAIVKDVVPERNSSRDAER